MARAPALQAGGRGFEPHILHEGRGRFRAAGSLTCWEESEIIEKRETSRVRFRRSREGLRRFRDKRARAHGGCLWLPEAMKGAAGSDIPRGGASGLRSAGTRMGQPAMRRHGTRRLAGANPANRNIQVAGGEENKSDPPSSGERKGASPNRVRRGARGVVGPAWRKKRR